MVAKYLYRKSDGVFLGGGFYDPPLTDPVNFGIAEFPDADQPNLKRHRFDPTTGKRLATAQELADAAEADLTERSQRTSRQKDILATVAFIIRHKDPAAWDAMTGAQKRNAVQAGADQWRDIRIFIEKNL